MHPKDQEPEIVQNPPSKVEDLPLEEGKESEVKGGPIYMQYEGLSVAPRRP